MTFWTVPRSRKGFLNLFKFEKFSSKFQISTSRGLKFNKWSRKNVITQASFLNTIYNSFRSEISEIYLV